MTGLAQDTLIYGVSGMQYILKVKTGCRWPHLDTGTRKCSILHFWRHI